MTDEELGRWIIRRAGLDMGNWGDVVLCTALGKAIRETAAPKPVATREATEKSGG